MLGPQGRAGFGDHGCTACPPHPSCPLDPGGSAPRHSHSSNSVYLQHAAVMSNREVMPDCRKGNKIQSLGCEWLFGRRRKEMAAPHPSSQHPPRQGLEQPQVGHSMHPISLWEGLAEEPEGSGNAASLCGLQQPSHLPSPAPTPHPSHSPSTARAPS